MALNDYINIRILAIDTGSTETGYAVIEMPHFKLIDFGKIDNNKLLDELPTINFDVAAVEMVASYGMPVGKEVFETCVWIGRFVQAMNDSHIEPKIKYIYRKDEKIMLCGTMKAKDTNIRQELINRYAKHDFKNGKGTKKNPDTFYGVSKDVWQAIAVGVTYYELMQEQKRQSNASL